MEWFLLRRFVDLVRIYFLLIVSRNHSNRVNIILISGYQQIYTGCYPLHNFYFNYMQINRWQNFKDKGYLFTLNLPMTTIIHRISLLRAFFFPVDKSVLLHCRFCLMQKFPEILIMLCRKTFCFLSNFSQNFFQQLWFCPYIRFNFLFKNLISSSSTLLQEAFLFNLD